MANVFKRAKTLWKQPQYKNKTWAQMVQIASGLAKAAPAKKSTAMATRKKKAAPRKRRSVSGVRTTTRTTTTRKRTKSVGAVVDRHMLNLAVGMALKSTVDAVLIDPITKRVPTNLAMVIDPVKAVVGYMATKKFKSPIIQGVALGVMADGVNGTVKSILGKMPMLSKPLIPAGTPSVSGWQLPNPSMGEIPQYLGSLGEIPQYLGNINDSPIPNMAGTDMGDIAPSDEIISPLGTHNGYL